ncbi:MAG: guanylate kinase [Bacteroidales bacterium]|nr:guanylate kinase [Bacteroidales bacterium]
MSNNKKVILFSAPSGCGKTTIIGRLLKYFDCFEFSISATSRAPRSGERNGVDYYYMSTAEFKERVQRGEFLEWEEVYEGTCYGTLRSEIERIWDNGHVILFDVDVKGGMNLKRHFGSNALSIFVMPPSVEELERRLRSRGTENEESIARRLKRSIDELQESGNFDHTVINDDLDRAVLEVKKLIEEFIYC